MSFMLNRAKWIVGLGLAVLVASALSLEGQETRGMIFGRVVDPQGSAAPGVEVLITNVDTNVSQRTVTNQTGYYEVPYLLPGNYQVTAELAGFKKFVRSGITLSVSSRAEVDIRLELGTVAESISVTADAPLLDTSSASSGFVIDNRFVMDLPVFGNSAILIAKLTPGIQTGGVNNYLGLHSNVGGSEYFLPGRVGGNEWSIDGVPNDGPSRRAAYLPYSDTIQEFKIETASFDASVGHTSGANIVMLSKSGANQFHGTLTEQHWQQRWNGTPWRTNMLYWGRIRDAELRGDTALAKKLRSEPSQPTGRSNNYAATIGGPVILPRVYNGKDRLFFFFSFNGFRDAKPEEANQINRTVPTTAQRQGDFSELLRFDAVRYTVYDPLTARADPARPGHIIRTPFPGNIIPEPRRNLNPMYAAYVKIYPTPNDNSNPEGRDNYRAIGTPFNWDYKAYANRVDFQIAPNHKVFGRWSWNNFQEDRGDWTYETLRGLHTNGLNRHNVGATADYVWTVNSRTVWNFAVAANEFREGDKITVPLTFKAADVGLPAYIDQKAGSFTILPQISIAGYQGIGRGYPGFTRFRMLAAKSDISQVRGSHTFTAGIDVRQHFRTGGNPGNSTGNFSFNNSYTRRADDTAAGPAGDLGLSWAAFMLGIPSGMSISTNDSYATHNPYYGWFVQDNWRATSRLSFTLGLRLEYEGGFSERYNRMIGGFDPNSRLPISDAAQAAYAQSPLPERPASSFVTRGGSLYVGSGAPRHLSKGELMWLPRIGVSYQLNSKTVLRGGYGLFFDTNNVLNNGPDQFGFSRGTGTTISTDFGQTWLAGDPPRGISPLRDPFPIRADGTRFNAPTRDQLGLMARAGRGFDYTDFNWLHARQQRWRFGVQRQFSTNMMLEVAYAGMYSDRISLTKRLSFLPEQYWADGLVRRSDIASDLNRNVPNPFNIRNFAFLQTSNPLVYQDLATQGFFTSSTIRKHQLLRDFPHMTSGDMLRNTRTPQGEARSHALEVVFEKRLSHGISAKLSYTRLYLEEADFYFYEWAERPSWRPSDDGRPHRLTVASIWELPFGKGKPFFKGGAPGAVLGGWQISMAVQYQPGELVDWGNPFYYGDVQDIIRGGSDRKLDQWFNARCATNESPAAFECRSSRVPDSFHRRVFPTRINGIRFDSTKQVDMNILRDFTVRERWKLQFRLDMINMPNHPQFGGPSTDPLSSNFGKVTSQSAATNRWIQLQFRLRF